VDTLHYRFGMQPNSYQRAIRSIGSIVAPYDTDQRFPVWGFGGRIDSNVSHCFALSGDEDNPEVAGVEGILKVYDKAFSWVTLSGPTLFSQIINTATVLSAGPQDVKQHYSILLILTDGVINDMENTKRAIIAACDYPLSIIIVGVGDADFSQMQELDGDDDGLHIDGKKASRDIVQFVAIRDFMGANSGRLTKETLVEVPTQFLQFMKGNHIVPMAKWCLMLTKSLRMCQLKKVKEICRVMILLSVRW